MGVCLVCLVFQRLQISASIFQPGNTLKVDITWL